MTTSVSPFTFLVSLAAVINGLGIVRLVTGFAAYLKIKNRLEIRQYWVFGLFAALQLMIHILLWWSMWGLRDAQNFNFVVYLYVLCGPTLLFLATSMLIPDLENEAIDLREVYFNVHRPYFSALALTWLWALFMMPVANGQWSPTTPVLTLFLLLALVSRLSGNHRVHAFSALAHWVALAVYIGWFAMELGGVATMLESGG